MNNVRILDQEFKVIKTHKIDVWDDSYNERFVDYFLGFGLVLGDISAEKLRLKGFQKGTKIDTIEKYIKQYCAYDAPYFILEKLDEVE